MEAPLAQVAQRGCIRSSLTKKRILCLNGVYCILTCSCCLLSFDWAPLRSWVCCLYSLPSGSCVHGWVSPGPSLLQAEQFQLWVSHPLDLRRMQRVGDIKGLKGVGVCVAHQRRNGKEEVAGVCVERTQGRRVIYVVDVAGGPMLRQGAPLKCGEVGSGALPRERVGQTL